MTDDVERAPGLQIEDAHALLRADDEPAIVGAERERISQALMRALDARAQLASDRFPDQDRHRPVPQILDLLAGGDERTVGTEGENAQPAERAVEADAH